MLERASCHRVPGRRQFCDLGLLPAGQRMPRRVVLRPGNRVRRGLRRQTTQHFQDVALPPPGPLDRRGRQPVQQPRRRHCPTCSGIDQGEVFTGLQHRQSHGRDVAVKVRYPYQGSGHPHYRVHSAAEPHPVTNAQHPGPSRRTHSSDPSAQQTTVAACIASPARSATRIWRHNR